MQHNGLQRKTNSVGIIKVHDKWVCVSLTVHRFRLKYLNNYRMDCHEICNRYSRSLEDTFE